MEIWCLLNPSIQVCLTFPLLCAQVSIPRTQVLLSDQVSGRLEEATLDKWPQNSKGGGETQEPQKGSPRGKKEGAGVHLFSCPHSPHNLEASRSVVDSKSHTHCVSDLGNQDSKIKSWAVPAACRAYLGSELRAEVASGQTAPRPSLAPPEALWPLTKGWGPFRASAAAPSSKALLVFPHEHSPARRTIHGILLALQTASLELRGWDHRVLSIARSLGGGHIFYFLPEKSQHMGKVRLVQRKVRHTLGQISRCDYFERGSV